MCGIAGVFGGKRLESSAISAVLESMKQRGPNAQRAWCGELCEYSLQLFQTRLAIVDLDDRSNQPFVKDDCVLIYNGEIYNYLELKHELESCGHSFKTNSDTEVLLEAYRKWGASCVDHMEGMWAFALVDLKKRSLFLSRDRFGEKPLFWCFLNGTVYFASETRTLWRMIGKKQPVNSRQVKKFLAFGYKVLFSNEETFYEGVYELPAGSNALLKRPGELVPQKYWALNYSPERMSLTEALEETKLRLTKAIGLRLRADVPVAYCLSGGVDSTAIAGIASKVFNHEVRAYSIYSDDPRYDESKNADHMVRYLNCQHVIARPEDLDFIARLNRMVVYHDAPVATISFYIQSLLAELIAEDGCRVALTGNGADELFTGYYDHYNFWLAAMQQNRSFPQLVDEWRRGYGQYVRNPVLSDPLCFVRDPKRRDHIFLKCDQFADLVGCTEMPEERSFTNDVLRNRLLNEVFHETLPVLLRENDLVFMEYSIENRTPFLDRQLSEFLATVPTEYLVHDGFQKYLLRKAVSEYVPYEIAFDRQKRGFNASFQKLLPLDFESNISWMLADSPIFDYVDRAKFLSYVSEVGSDNSDSKFLFSFVSTKLFLENAALSDG